MQKEFKTIEKKHKTILTGKNLWNILNIYDKQMATFPQKIYRKRKPIKREREREKWKPIEKNGQKL